MLFCLTYLNLKLWIVNNIFFSFLFFFYVLIIINIILLFITYNAFNVDIYFYIIFM